MILTNSQISELNTLIDNGSVKATKHPYLPLTIYKYSKELQYSIKFDINNNFSEKPDDTKWTNLLKMCRGLIVEDFTNVIVAKGFDKFFNASEYGFDYVKNRMNRVKYNFYEKFDGSLIILYNYNGIWDTATNGSFFSDQAIKAKKLFLNSKYTNLNKDYIYLLEYVSPDNRVVVSYEKEKLILLSILDRSKSFNEVDIKSEFYLSGFYVSPKLVISKHLTDNLESITKLNIHNKEGFVIRFEDGFRVKLKFEEYVKLHKITTELSDKAILNFLIKGQSSVNILKDIPDELHKWIYDTEKKYIDWYNRYYNYAYAVYNKYKHIKDQKDFALNIINKKYNYLVFSIRNNRLNKLEEDIWQLVEIKRKKLYKSLTYFKNKESL